VSRLEKSKDKDEMGFLVRVASFAGATRHELEDALNGRKYNFYTADINKEKRWRW